MLNLNSLNPQQRQAVEAVKGPVLILAGAGTGKTRVITFRIARMLQKGIPPGNILGVTFTNKAAREMQERVFKLLPRRPRSRHPEGKAAADDRPTICTFHSLCVRILRQHIEKLGYKRNFVIYDESEQVGAIKKILSHMYPKGVKAEPSAILGQLSRLKNAGEAAPFYGDADARALALHLRPRYESALRACNAVDFDDLILLALQLFTEHPDALESCRQKYQFVMVDEYQDTNHAQFKLIRALTETHRNLCVVGDDDQSIYGWRGAEISNLLDMEKHFPEVKVIKLEQNYRSTNTILKAANAVITRNAQRRGKTLWSEKGEGERIVLQAYDNDEEEAKGTVDEIETARVVHRVPWSEQAILFRTNMQSRPLETALRQRNVRYHLIGGQSFFDRREVRDFLAYLKMFVNPHDDISLLRIANVPARGLSDVTMERLVHASGERKCSVFTAMKNPVVATSFMSRTRESIEDFVHFIERKRELLHLTSTGGDPHGLQEWASRFIDEIGYLEDLRRSEKNHEAAESRVRNLKELICTLDRPEAAGKSAMERLELFLEEITLDSEREDEEEEAGEAVTLITMHSCKGLEFPNVYIVGLEEGLLPHTRSKEENSVDEERRLFYVALTRAMRTLTISHCASRKKYGHATPAHPSQFLHDLPPDLIEHGTGAAKKAVTPSSGKSLFAGMIASLD